MKCGGNHSLVQIGGDPPFLFSSALHKPPPPCTRLWFGPPTTSYTRVSWGLSVLNIRRQTSAFCMPISAVTFPSYPVITQEETHKHRQKTQALLSNGGTVNFVQWLRFFDGTKQQSGTLEDLEHTSRMQQLGKATSIWESSMWTQLRQLWRANISVA